MLNFLKVSQLRSLLILAIESEIRNLEKKFKKHSTSIILLSIKNFNFIIICLSTLCFLFPM